jgi:hypothetical protein
MADVLGEVWDALGGAPARLVQVGVVADEPDVLPAPGPGVGLEIDHAGRRPGRGVQRSRCRTGGDDRVRLAGKAAAAASAAGDGFAGQVARLRRAFEGSPLRDVDVVVAAGAAGRPAVQAAGGARRVAAVVTVGTPWTALSLDDVDIDPAAGALVMLRTLIDLADADLPPSWRRSRRRARRILGRRRRPRAGPRPRGLLLARDGAATAHRAVGLDRCRRAWRFTP